MHHHLCNLKKKKLRITVTSVTAKHRLLEQHIGWLPWEPLAAEAYVLSRNDFTPVVTFY